MIYNHLVNIQQKTLSQDTIKGSVEPTWTTIHYDVPAKIEALSVKDYIQSQADQSDIQCRVTLPYMPDLDSTMRFVGLCDCHLGLIYNIKGKLEDNITTREYITFPCSQGVNTG